MGVSWVHLDIHSVSGGCVGPSGHAQWDWAPGRFDAVNSDRGAEGIAVADKHDGTL